MRRLGGWLELWLFELLAVLATRRHRRHHHR